MSNPEGPRIWSVFNRDDRLVLALSDEPGEFNFARIPDDDCDPVVCDFATIQCYDLKAEPEILNILMRCMDLEDFIDRLLSGGYKVQEGRPTPMSSTRL